jgi:PBP1b-binding outer membrane lipoprotein LpoB
MKTIKNLFVLALIVFLGSCATNTKFPVSSVVPAANISAKKKTDKQQNFTLEITSENLASASRLSPPGNNYSIWIVTKAYGVKNVGQLTIKNARKTTFKTVTAFDFNEVFITVENQGNLLYPQGTEIARTKL